MPRGERFTLPIHQVYIADGFSSDCDEFVHRCLQFKPLNYHDFAKVWKEMNFDLLYEGRSSSTEIGELSEELIHIAKHYMVKDTSYFEESVTGLFLVYGLLNLQPFAGFARLRLVPDDVPAVRRIEAVARRERRLDVLFILGEVLVKWTDYHADERPRGMEGVLRKYLEGYTSIDMLGVRPMGVFYRQTEELEHIRDLGSVMRQYTLAKAVLVGDNTKVPSLQYLNKNLANELGLSLRTLITGAIRHVDGQEPANDASSEEEHKMAEERSRSLQSIKAKAMSNAVGPMNHLTSGDRRKKTKTSPKNRSDLKKPTGRIKTGMHTRPVTASPKKPKDEVKPRRKPKSKGDLYKDLHDDDLNMEEFNQISDSDDDSDNNDDDGDHNDDDGDHNDDDGDHNDDDEKSNCASAEQKNHDCQNEQQCTDIKIDSPFIPLILKAGDMGPDIEIEFIDHTKSTTDKTVPITSETPYNAIEIIYDTKSKTNKIELKNTCSSKNTTTFNSDQIEIIEPTRKNKASKTKSTRTNSPKITNSSKASTSKDEDALSVMPNIVRTYKRKRKGEQMEEVKLLPLKKKERKELLRRDFKAKLRRFGILSIADLENEK